MTEPPADELIAQAELRRASSAHLREAMTSTVGVAVDQHGIVEATVTAGGELRGLRLHPNAMRADPVELGRIVVATARQAAEFAVQRCLNQLAVVLGDQATTFVEGMVGIAPARAAGWDVVTIAREQREQQRQQRNSDPGDLGGVDFSALRSDR